MLTLWLGMTNLFRAQCGIFTPETQSCNIGQKGQTGVIWRRQAVVIDQHEEKSPSDRLQLSLQILMKEDTLLL